MPRGDGTGPWGMGPREPGPGGCLGMGWSAGFGRGAGLARGMRAGFGRWFGFTGDNYPTPENLEAQAERLEQQAARLRNLAERQNPKTE